MLLESDVFSCFTSVQNSFFLIKLLSHWITRIKDKVLFFGLSFLSKSSVWGYTQEHKHTWGGQLKNEISLILCAVLTRVYANVHSVYMSVFALVSTGPCISGLVCESVCVGNRWKVHVLSPAVSLCHVLQPVRSAPWLELSTVMWWHGLKPQQGSESGERWGEIDGERRFGCHVEIRDKVWERRFWEKSWPWLQLQ